MNPRSGFGRSKGTPIRPLFFVYFSENRRNKKSSRFDYCMKRKDLLKILKINGCILLRNGVKHDIYYDPNKGTTQPIPRQNEILAKKIIKDLT